MPKHRRAPGEGSIYQRGKEGRWVASITVPGPPGGTQQRRTRYARTKTEAAHRLEQLRAEIRDGYHTPSTLTVHEFVLEWFDAHRNNWKPATIDIYERTIRNHIEPDIGRLRLKDVNAYAIRRALDKTEETGGVSIAKTTRTILNSACEWAVQTYMLPRNPVTAVRATAVTKREAVLWSPDETQAFLRAAADHPLFAYFYMLLTTGLRRGEALALTWADLRGNRVSVRHTVNHIGNRLVMGEPKSKKARRTIVIPPDTLEILSRYKARMERELALRGATVQDSTPMFCDEFGGVRDPKAVWKEFKRLAAAAGMPDCTLHDLRHWHAGLHPARPAALACQQPDSGWPGPAGGGGAPGACERESDAWDVFACVR